MEYMVNIAGVNKKLYTLDLTSVSAYNTFKGHLRNSVRQHTMSSNDLIQPLLDWTVEIT